MSGKSAVAVIARHELVSANGRAAPLAGGTLSARDDRGHDYQPSSPLTGIIAGGDDAPANFVSQN
jgi:hypothetical protein